jgi:hypothetical protein
VPAKIALKATESFAQVILIDRLVTVDPAMEAAKERLAISSAGVENGIGCRPPTPRNRRPWRAVPCSLPSLDASQHPVDHRALVARREVAVALRHLKLAVCPSKSPISSSVAPLCASIEAHE